MAVPVDIYIEDVATQMATYDTLRIYRDTSPTGAFSTLISSQALVAGQLDYEYEDSAGTVDSWYRYLLYSSSTAATTSLSAPFRPLEQTLRTIRLESARKAHMGFASTSQTSNVAYLVDTGLGDSGLDSSYLEGAWIYRPAAAAAADRLRRVKKDGWDATNSRLTPTRVWSAAPTDEEYHVFLGPFPPIDATGQAYSWDRIIRDALEELWYEDEVDLGPGDNSSYRFDLHDRGATLLRDDIRYVLLRYTDADGHETDTDMGKNGRYYDLLPNGSALRLHLSTIPRTDQHIIVGILRHYELPYSDTDQTDCPLPLAVRATLYRYYRELNSYEEGKWATAESRALRELNEIAPSYMARGAVVYA